MLQPLQICLRYQTKSCWTLLLLTSDNFSSLRIFWSSLKLFCETSLWFSAPLSSHRLCSWIMGPLVFMLVCVWSWQQGEESPSVHSPEKWRNPLPRSQTETRVLRKQRHMWQCQRYNLCVTACDLHLCMWELLVWTLLLINLVSVFSKRGLVRSCTVNNTFPNICCDIQHPAGIFLHLSYRLHY